MAKRLVGTVSHYYSKIGVAIVEMKDSLELGDTISFQGPNTDLVQAVNSMQVEHEAVTAANRGMSVGMKVNDKVRPGDNVYLEEE